MRSKDFINCLLLSMLMGCGTLATELDNSTNTLINRQEHHSVDIERSKIIYTDDNCEGDVTEVESSKCARVLKDKGAKGKSKIDG